MFGFKKRAAGPPSTASQHHSTTSDARLPGSAGYIGNGIGKNAMPERRFTFVRPDQQNRR
ncbi:MAG: hypothetical protein ACLGI5_19200 [Thermoleophilia bacterium]